jgi:hypothetical protein
MKEIAQRLVVSPKTVDHHVQHIYTKIDVRTRAAARLFAIEHGLISDLAHDDVEGAEDHDRVSRTSGRCTTPSSTA